VGWAKQKMIEEQERGWSSIGNKFVCDECFDDYALKEFIRQNAEEAYCDYCERSLDSEIAAPIDHVMEHIANGIYSEWDHPVNEVGWDSREGGWMGVSIYDTYDVLADVELGTDNDALIDDIANAFHDTEWCEAFPMATRFHKIYSSKVRKTMVN